MISDNPGRQQLKIGCNTELLEALEDLAEKEERPVSTVARSLLAEKLDEIFSPKPAAKSSQERASSNEEAEDVILLSDVLAEGGEQSEDSAKGPSSSKKNPHGINIIIHNHY